MIATQFSYRNLKTENPQEQQKGIRAFTIYNLTYNKQSWGYSLSNLWNKYRRKSMTMFVAKTRRSDGSSTSTVLIHFFFSLWAPRLFWDVQLFSVSALLYGDYCICPQFSFNFSVKVSGMLVYLCMPNSMHKWFGPWPKPSVKLIPSRPAKKNQWNKLNDLIWRAYSFHYASTLQ